MWAVEIRGGRMNRGEEYCDCDDKTQCWEPCGDLGHSEEHAVQRSLTQTEEIALQSALRKSSKLVMLGEMKK